MINWSASVLFITSNSNTLAFYCCPMRIPSVLNRSVFRTLPTESFIALFKYTSDPAIVQRKVNETGGPDFVCVRFIVSPKSGAGCFTQRETNQSFLSRTRSEDSAKNFDKLNSKISRLFIFHSNAVLALRHLFSVRSCDLKK